MQYLNYILTFPNGKMYIGYTKSSIKKRLREHKRFASKNLRSRLYCAWRKYKANITVDIIAEFDNKYDAVMNEIRLIALFNTTSHEFGYNSTKGGEYSPVGFGGGLWRNSKTREELAAIDQGKSCPGEKNPFFGKVHSLETIKKAVEVRRCNGSYDSSWCAGKLMHANRYEYREEKFSNYRQISSRFKLSSKTIVKLVKSGGIKCLL